MTLTAAHRLGKTTALPARVVLPDGAVEALKWIALVAMTGDHINAYLYHWGLPVLFEVGRLALPIFAFVLAYNLSRPGMMERGAYVRTMKRMAVFGAVATVPFVALRQDTIGWLPLNILFTLLLITFCVYLIEQGSARSLLLAGLTFLLGSVWVEFMWPAVAFGVAVWAYCRRPTWALAICVIAACASLWIVNGNLWALAALPIIGVVGRLDMKVPRLRWVFYAYYPAHLGVLWLIRQIIYPGAPPGIV